MAGNLDRNRKEMICIQITFGHYVVSCWSDQGVDHEITLGQLMPYNPASQERKIEIFEPCKMKDNYLAITFYAQIMLLLVSSMLPTKPLI